MNSKTLKEDGFADFHPLKELAPLHMPKNEGHVFVLIDTTLSEEPSDILYIGRAKRPMKKVFGGYIGGSGGKAIKKIHKALFNDSYLEKVSISWLASENPKITQRELLEKFRNTHGQYPPWNAPKKVPAKTKPAQEPTASQRIRKRSTNRSQGPQ